MKSDYVIPKLMKGLIYGLVIGIILGLGIYLLVGAVIALGFITVSPEMLAGLVFAACVLGGTAIEYADWIDAKLERQNRQ